MDGVRVEGRPRVAARAAILSEMGWLILKAADPGPPWYVLPGGGVYENEYIRHALRREIQEELDVDIAIGPPIAIGDRIPDKLVNGSSRWVHTVSLTFLAEIREGKPRLADGMDEDISEWRWANNQELENLDLYPRALKSRLMRGDLTMRYAGPPLYLEAR